ncbi:phage tail assembly chaperone [Aliiruegeria sabulilitoris]|uniref:phage tail assembly chaperone n=1 Tax=Aliiruegeria sabulilitoris TaxID=1510458 RepID=UPI0008328B29|nr:phage tail assembly chaperone [Aliiruegeria sabulilitoris]NDR56062.1 phage tail assembly chaperone [Pseudoruegeria sp. M32A2M]
MDWAGLMRLGLRELGLAPEAFWKLTPVELLVKLGADASRPAFSRARLNELARAFPDRNRKTDHGL